MGQPVSWQGWPLAEAKRATTLAVTPKLTTTEPTGKLLAIAGPLSGLLFGGIAVQQRDSNPSAWVCQRVFDTHPKILEGKAKAL